MNKKSIINYIIFDQIIFSVINGRIPPNLFEAFNDPDFLPYLDRNGIAGVFFYHCCHLGIFPFKGDFAYLQNSSGQAPAFSFLQDRYQLQIRQNMAAIAEAKKVFQSLDAAGIQFIVLKGISLLEMIYPHFAMRTTSDLDLLVHREDLRRADESLRKDGYYPMDSTPERAILNPPGYLASLEYHRSLGSFSYIHLHWHLINTSTPATAYIDNIDLERLWHYSRKTVIAGREALIFCPEHLLIYLCEHSLRVGHSFDRLILICDLLYTIRRCGNDIDWSFLHAEALRMGLLNFVYFALRIVHAYCGEEVIREAIINRFSPADISYLEKAFLAFQLAHRRVRGSSYLVHLALHKGLTAKINMVYRTFFPPRAILGQRQRLSSFNNSTSYYLKRIYEISHHLFSVLKSSGHNMT